MVGDEHQRPRRPINADAARGIAQDDDARAQAVHEQHRLDHQTLRVALVKVQPALQADHRHAVEMTQQQPSRMARRGRGRPTGEFVKRNRDGVGHRVGETAQLRCRVDFRAAVERPTIGILIRDRLGNDVFGTNTHHLSVFEPRLEAGESLLATFTTRLELGPGSYSVTIAAHTDRSHVEQSFDWWDRAAVFEVIPNDAFHFVGSAFLPVEVSLERVARGSGLGPRD